MSNGDIYFGDWESGTFNGYGVYAYNSGELFQGFLKKGQKHGRGTL